MSTSSMKGLDVLSGERGQLDRHAPVRQELSELSTGFRVGLDGARAEVCGPLSGAAN